MKIRVTKDGQTLMETFFVHGELLEEAVKESVSMYVIAEGLAQKGEFELQRIAAE